MKETFKNSVSILTVIIVICILSVLVGTQFMKIESTSELDSSIRFGKLENGLTYYIKHIDSSKQINMRLNVKVGGYYEKRNEHDFAHAIEHLAFKCAKHFKQNLLENTELYSKLGMTRFDIHASTGVFRTRYIFNVPFDRMDALETGLLWFHDITDLKLDKKDVDSERGPLRREIIYRQGAILDEFFLRNQLESSLYPCHNDFSNFFEHNKNFSYQALLDFYNTWYRPDRMAVVIVGNISDLEAIENKVIERFSKIKRDSPSKEWKDCRLKYLNQPHQFIHLQKKQNELDTLRGPVEFNLFFRDEKIFKLRENWEGVKRAKVWEVIGQLINQRFKVSAQEYNTSFSVYGYAPNLYSIPAYRLKITEKNGEGMKALQKTVGILRGIQKYGFTQNEWEQLKQDQTVLYNTSSERDTTSASYWIGQISKHFVFKEPLPKKKLAKLHHWVLSKSVEDINQLISQYLLIIPDDIAIISSYAESYKESQVRSWLKKGLSQEILPYKKPKVPAQLLSKDEIRNLEEVKFIDDSYEIRTQGSTMIKTVLPKGVKEFILDNGVKVVLDTSGGNNNRVYLRAFRRKGASSFPKKDYFTAVLAPSIIKNAGVGSLNKFELNRFLAKTSFWQGVIPYVDYAETGIKGNADLKDLETLLQLVYLYFTKPRNDVEAFKDWKMVERDKYLNSVFSASAQRKDFNKNIRGFIGDSTETPMGTERFQHVSGVELDRAYEIYRELFGDAKQFTFLIGGNFSQDKILPLIQKYLGNLPNSTEAFSCILKGDKGVQLPEGPLYKEFATSKLRNPSTNNNRSAKYTLRYIAKVPTISNWMEHVKVSIIGSLLSSKIMELRFDKQAALYAPTAGSVFNRNAQYYDFSLHTNCSPEDLETIKKLFNQLIERVKLNSFSETRIEDVLNGRILPKVNAEGNRTSAKLQKLYHYYRYDIPWVSSEIIINYINTLTPKDLQQTMRKYFKEEYKMEFVMK